MPDLKLPKIPERTPVKLTILIPPDLARSLQDYAAVYEAEYGSSEEVQALVPHMLANFLENDRAFQQARKSLASHGKTVEPAKKAQNADA